MSSSSKLPSRVHDTGRITTHTLVGVGGWLNEQRFSITHTQILGRDSSCGIVIPGNYLSRQHAELKPVGLTLVVKDLGSSNGTFYKNERVDHVVLHHGDEIRFDKLCFRLEIKTTNTNHDTHNQAHEALSSSEVVSNGGATPVSTNPELAPMYTPPPPPIKPAIMIGPWLAMALASLLLAVVMILFL